MASVSQSRVVPSMFLRFPPSLCLQPSPVRTMGCLPGGGSAQRMRGRCGVVAGAALLTSGAGPGTGSTACHRETCGRHRTERVPHLRRGPHHLSPLSQRRGGASAGHFESARRAGALQSWSLPRERAAPGCPDVRPKTGDLLVQEGLSRPGSGNHDLIADRAEKALAAVTVPEGPVGAPRAEFSSGCRGRGRHHGPRGPGLNYSAGGAVPRNSGEMRAHRQRGVEMEADGAAPPPPPPEPAPPLHTSGPALPYARALPPRARPGPRRGAGSAQAPPPHVFPQLLTPGSPRPLSLPYRSHQGPSPPGVLLGRRRARAFSPCTGDATATLPTAT